MTFLKVKPNFKTKTDVMKLSESTLKNMHVIHVSH